MTEQQLSIDDLAPRKRPIEDVTGLARWNDPHTSQDAAKTITGRTEQRLMLVFYYYNRTDRDGWTADELCEELSTIYPPTLVSALSRLHKHQLIEDSGETRPSRRNCQQTVWKLAPVSSPGSREEQ